MRAFISSRVVELGPVTLLGVLALTGCSAMDSSGDELAGPNRNPRGACVLPAEARSFAQQATDAAHIDGACVPEYSSTDLRSAFSMIRDDRMLAVTDQPNFPRRIPWLAVDNGCEERAPAAVFFLDQGGFTAPYYARVKPKPRQSLGLSTDNDPSGKVSWGHHVAPVVRVGNDLMVLDPAIDPSAPLPIRDWVGRFNQGKEVDVALCRDVEVGDGCFAASPIPPHAPQNPASPGNIMYMRLDTERRVQELLGRDPNRVLGNCPPWLSCAVPEPAADPTQPPRIRKFASDQFIDEVYAAIYIIGDNFVPGLTTVHIQGPDVDVMAPIEKINRLRILLGESYPVGSYRVTAANGTHVSDVATLNIE